MNNPYLELTAAFNEGRLRALLSSGQAVVVHRLAIMSKDGDWVLREDEEACGHVLRTLADRRARYRFGAPLDRRWLEGGWSSHFEYKWRAMRLRTDFVSRPPRVDQRQLAAMWSDAEVASNKVVPIEPLAALKLTRREKDYAVVGELARLMGDPRSQLLYSRSSRDLMALAAAHPEALAETTGRRPLLAHIAGGRAVLDQELDRERRSLMQADEERLARYGRAAERWADRWPDVEREVAGLPLLEAHAVVTARAEGLLPFGVPA